MGMVKRTMSELKARYLSCRTAGSVPLYLEQPVFTVTFDDVPHSALKNGPSILENYGVRATWYFSHSFLGQDFGTDDIRMLVEHGHDIQCHSYSHYQLSHGSAQGLYQDARKNRAFLKENIIPEHSIEHFSYPFGEVSVSAKRLLLRDYKTLRSVYPGVNIGRVDLGLLRANPIYLSTFNPNNFSKLVALAVENNGWLILYTHGVDVSPDRWSCTPELLESAIDSCIKAGLIPRTITQTYRYIKEVADSNGT